MDILEINDPAQEQKWDRYALGKTQTIMDLAGWRHVARDTYGIKSFFLAAVDNDHIAGTLALYEIKHPLFGHYLLTAPFGTEGGLLYDSDSARNLLLEAARKLADRHEVDYLVIRLKNNDLHGFTVDHRFCTAFIALEPGSDHLWNKRIPSKTKNQVRKGMKDSFQTDCGNHLVEDFYELISTHMRNLGSPWHGLDFYKNIVKYMGSRSEFIVIKEGSNLVAGALLFHVNQTVQNVWAIALNKYNSRCANYKMHWDFLQESCRQGYKWFDMGRSIIGSRAMEFKKNWNPDVVTLSYNFYLRRVKEPPFNDPRNPLFAAPIFVWKKLPLALTRRIGPRLIWGLA